MSWITFTRLELSLSVSGPSVCNWKEARPFIRDKPFETLTWRLKLLFCLLRIWDWGDRSMTLIFKSSCEKKEKPPIKDDDREEPKTGDILQNSHEYQSLKVSSERPNDCLLHHDNNSKITITLLQKDSVEKKVQSIVQKDLWDKAHSPIWQGANCWRPNTIYMRYRLVRILIIFMSYWWSCESCRFWLCHLIHSNGTVYCKRYCS